MKSTCALSDLMGFIGTEESSVDGKPNLPRPRLKNVNVPLHLEREEDPMATNVLVRTSPTTATSIVIKPKRNIFGTEHSRGNGKGTHPEQTLHRKRKKKCIPSSHATTTR